MMQFRFAAKSFGADRVLDPVTLDLREGGVTALVGPSGVGKTTLLRLVAGLEADDSGAVQVQNRVGVVFQEPRLLPWKTVRQNIELVASENGWLARLGLAGTDSLYPRQLSLGMARRVALARAFAFGPELLILDEPFASLDEATARGVKAELAALLEAEKVTTLLVTHDLADVAELADEVLSLEGRPARLRS